MGKDARTVDFCFQVVAKRSVMVFGVLLNVANVVHRRGSDVRVCGKVS